MELREAVGRLKDFLPYNPLDANSKDLQALRTVIEYAERSTELVENLPESYLFKSEVHHFPIGIQVRATAFIDGSVVAAQFMFPDELSGQAWRLHQQINLGREEMVQRIIDARIQNHIRKEPTTE